MLLQRLVLVLNSGYVAVNVIAARRAITMVLNGKAHLVEPSDQFIRAGRMRLQVPSVIRVSQYHKVPHQNRNVSRKTILLRDRFTCQYCGGVQGQAGLTLDHVIPKSRRGPNTWENLVACCHRCNHRKADRTPDEAGMMLLHKPARIGIHAKHRLLAAGGGDPIWDRYLFC